MPHLLVENLLGDHLNHLHDIRSMGAGLSGIQRDGLDLHTHMKSKALKDCSSSSLRANNRRQIEAG
jgi:hypothetical protein